MAPGQLVTFSNGIVVWDRPEVELEVCFHHVGELPPSCTCLVVSVTPSHSFLSDILLLASDGTFGWVTLGPNGIKQRVIVHA